jgi:hypothetical protein
MIVCIIAAKLHKKVFCDGGGQIVDEEDAFGLPTEYVLTHWSSHGCVCRQNRLEHKPEDGWTQGGRIVCSSS